jgi:hypothetical protein
MYDNKFDEASMNFLLWAEEKIRSLCRRIKSVLSNRFIWFVLVVCLAIWMMRFSLEVAPNGAAYRLNRFTGEIIYIRGPDKVKVGFLEPTYTELPPGTLLDHEKKK